MPAGLIAQAAPNGAAPALHGRVIDAGTLRGVPGVAIVLTAGTDTVGRAVSDTAGAFSVAGARNGTAVAHFMRTGYRTDSIATELAAAIRPPLHVAMLALRPSVVATLQATKVIAAPTSDGFARRAARKKGGVFITQEQLEKSGAVHTSDAFRFVTGIVVRDSAGVTQVISSRGTRPTFVGINSAIAVGPGTERSGGKPAPFAQDTTRASAGRRCALRVGLDGRLMDPAFSIDDVPVRDIRGMEVYVGPASVPVEFSGLASGTDCGLVMIWTRTGKTQ